MTTSLIITTYNWKEALELVLLSVLRQTLLPDEIIIADDGSREDTKILIEKYKIIFSIPLIHSWQKDEGFRAASSRNKAISKAQGNYIILVDGDMILDKNFIKDHVKFAKRGYFSQGSRVLIGKTKSEIILKSKKIDFSIYEQDLSNRKNLIKSALLSNLSKGYKKNIKGIKTCNLAFFKKDCLDINGFNEDFIGWGREDSEFVVRLINNKIMRQNIKFSAISLHIYHELNSKKMLKENNEILELSIKNNLIFCNNGINKYLKDKNES